ncbi:MAG TPA: type VI secretion system tube protein Hcp [Tabrizicola sp.]|nr:type VI secretion system tube protein Hcp [Tabrizicola sp.]
MAAGIFIDLGNGIKGESTQIGFEDHIAASSLQWGASRAIGAFTSGIRETSRPNFSEVVFSKTVDISTNDIVGAMTKGKSLATVMISFVRDDGEDGFTYLTYELTDVFISSYSVSSAGETPMESVALNFAKIKSVYKKLASDHSGAGENEFEYDLKAQA